MSVETIVTILGALGVGGLLGVLLNRRFEQQKQINDHDLRIFHQSNEILTEQKIYAVINSYLIDYHLIDYPDYCSFLEWCGFFEQIGNQYIDKKINKDTQRLADNLKRLADFVNDNFFTITGQSPRNKNLYLRPECSPDYVANITSEKIILYNKYVKELEEISKEVLKQYSKYRLIIKQKLRA